MINLVSIITRTQNRTIFLERLKISLLAQTYKNFCWIIVNDGGSNVVEIDTIANEVRSFGFEVVVTHSTVSKGRSNAANLGISRAGSKYVMLLDDDDTLEPMCLELEVNFLEQNYGLFAGVVCHVQNIQEHVVDCKIGFCKANGIFANDTESFAIGKVFSINPIMTCGFLYRREVWESIGGYPEHIDYTEDWYFNVQFILRFNVGIITTVLANAHNRVGADGAYSNTKSTHEKIVRHELAALAWKNNLLRQLANENNPLLVLLASSMNNRDIHLMRSQQISMNAQVKTVLKFMQKSIKYTGVSFFITIFRKIKNYSNKS